MIRPRELALAAVFVIAACEGPGRERWIAADEVTVHDFVRHMPVSGSAIIGARGGEMIGVWADEEGVWTLRMDSGGRPLDKPVQVLEGDASHLAAADLGDECAAGGVRNVVVSTPRSTPTAGNVPLKLALLDEQGRPLASYSYPSKVGPYTRGVSVAGDCEGIFVGWHQGIVGDSASMLGFVDPDGGALLWEIRLEGDGVNGFAPALLGDAGRVFAVWGEMEVRFTPRGQPPVKGSIATATVGRDGRIARQRLKLVETWMPAMMPSLSRIGDRWAVLYKDDPPEEDHEGVYLAFADGAGSLVGNPSRIGRGDGPDSPVLVKMPGGGLATAVVRGLAEDLLIGMNFLDADGSAQTRELQLYAHRVRFRHLSMIAEGIDLVLFYVDGSKTRSRLLLSRIHRTKTRYTGL